MLKDYVFKVRRDFSSILIPSRVFAPRFVKKKSNARRAFDCIGRYTADHALACDCRHCVAALENISSGPGVNSSVNGYKLGSRSRVAIKNAANSLFFRCEKKQYLRFVTFTFPPASKSFSDKPAEDKYLHNLFKKFLDNERKNYGLSKWLWVNERQSGDRLESYERNAREVLHYHCIFEYENRINYYLVNLRFLRLLYRNNFNILSSYSQAVTKTSLNYPKLRKTCQAIAKGDYNYIVQDSERLYLRDELGIKRFIFLSPVDFEKIRYSSLDIGRVSAYLSKYVSKSSDKIYCRRWGSSQGLVLKEKDLKAFQLEFAELEVVNDDTGEIIQCIDQKKLFNFLVMGDENVSLLKFKIDLGRGDEDCYYIPPNWQKWRKHSAILNLFRKYFGYEI